MPMKFRFCFSPIRTFFSALILSTFWIGAAMGQSSAPANGCSGQPIVIADLQWPSASVMAHIHAKIIAKELDCATQVAITDIESAATTLKTAQTPTMIPEMWTTRVAERWNKVLEERAGFVAGSTYERDLFEGWYISAKSAQDFPALLNVANLKNIQELYQLEQKPDFISCPADWACAVINRHMLQAFDLEGVFNVVVPQNRIEMDQRIGNAISGNKPVLFYYWEPNPLVHELAVARIEMGPFVPQAYGCFGQSRCDSPQPSSFPKEQVEVVVASWVRGEAPELLPYVRKAKMPISIMNELLALELEQGISAEAVADHFVNSYPDVWQSWLPVIAQ